MGRIEKWIIIFISSGFVDSRLVPELGAYTEQGASVSDSVFVKEDRSSQGLNWKTNVLVIPNRIGSCPRYLEKWIRIIHL